MFFQSSKILAIVALFCAGATAAPATDDSKLPNLHVLVRGENNTYVRSEEREAEIRAPHASNFDKRAFADVQACYTQECTDCHTVFDQHLEANSHCVSAVNTACLIIRDLSNANVEFWNHQGCNGHNSVYRGCNKPATAVPAPGTNSLGVHLGC